MSKSLVRKILLLGVIVSSVALTSCYAPEPVITEYDNVAKDQEYKFDIVVLSEWGGHILPETETLDIYVGEKAYDFSGVRVKTEGGENKLMFGDAEVQVGDLSVPLADAGILVKDDTIEFSPITTRSDVTISCTALKEQNDVFLDILRAEDETAKLYRCDYTVGGSLALRDTWDLLKKNKTQFYVGNGDSFGVSQATSAVFNDVPTPQILSLLKLDVDTFGNHNFDKRMSYLEPLIDLANPGKKTDRLGYRYVATNLNDEENEKKWLTHYKAVVPSHEGKGEGLAVAFIGALDTTVFSTTKSGVMGTLRIDEKMCSVVNELEMAYNENARAFFILAHVLTGSVTFRKLMDAIFTFSNSYLKDYVENGKISERFYLSECNSKLVVPPERLEEVFGTRFINKIDLSKKENKAKYAKIIDDIRLEIFNGIIGVVGEGRSEPSVVAYYADQLNTYPEYGMEWSTGCSKETGALKSEIDKHNIICEYRCADGDDECFSKSCSLEIERDEYEGIASDCNGSLMDNAYCVEIKFEEEQETNDLRSHPIYYIQVPGQGTHALSLSISAQKNEDINNGDGVASAYTTRIDSIKIYPVISPIEDASQSEETIDLLDPSYTACKSLVEDVDERLKKFSKGGYEGKSCSDFFEKMSLMPKMYTSIDALKSDSLSGENASKYDPNSYYQSYLQCEAAFNSYIFTKSSDDDSNLELASAFWACMSSATTSILCGEKSFVKPRIFKFDNYTETTMTEDRMRTTYNTNIITTGYFNYAANDSKEDVTFDVGLINVGTMREGDFSVFNETTLSQIVPFDNKLQYVSVPVEDLIPIIQLALEKANQEINADYGGFPSVARMAIAYKHISNEQGENSGEDVEVREGDESVGRIEITEVWLTDPYGAFTDLIYLRDLNQKYFATYERKDGKIVASFRENEPWLCGKGGQTVSCFDQDPMKFDFTHVDSGNGNVPGYYLKKKNLTVLTHSFLMNGGDGYRQFLGQSVNDVKNQGEYVRPAILKYYSGSDQSLDSNGIVDIETVCSSATKEYMTIDGLKPEELDCILYLNHFYRVDTLDEEKSPWIDGISETLRRNLNDRCLKKVEK